MSDAKKPKKFCGVEIPSTGKICGRSEPHDHCREEVTTETARTWWYCCELMPCAIHPPSPRPESREARLLDRMPRVRELADRLVAAGPKAAHISASECHEIRDWVMDVGAALSAPQPATEEKLDQFDAYGITVKSALDDRDALAKVREERDELAKALLGEVYARTLTEERIREAANDAGKRWTRAAYSDGASSPDFPGGKDAANALATVLHDTKQLAENTIRLNKATGAVTNAALSRASGGKTK